ncbi:NUMOD4 domain-containing protein [Lactococcus hircilactis]
MKEVFKNVNGFESRYQVSNFGRVISLNYNKTGKTRELKYYKGLVWKYA